MSIENRIIQATGFRSWQVQNTLSLLNDGASIPFISRYRKEKTGGLDEVQIQEVRDLNKRYTELEERRTFVLNTIEESGNLSSELKSRIEKAETLAELEDLYLPYKPRKRTRAQIAREKGLEPLAKIIMAQSKADPLELAAQFVSQKKDVKNEEEAIKGASDIIAEWVSEHAYARKKIRYLFRKEARLISKLAKGKDEEGEKYRDYFDWSESARKAPSHRVLAIFRAEKEGILKVKIEPEQDAALQILEEIFLKSFFQTADVVRKAIADSYKRLLAPSIETEIRSEMKGKADEAAIKVFVNNLRQLLLAPPLGQKRVMAIDPGFRTGCKVVCLDAQGKLLHNETIFPHPPRAEKKQAMSKILSLVSAYDIEAIAIGNGTAGRETENLVSRIRFPKDIMAVMVNESGASVYSASKIARDEFPEYDVTVRGSVSIGRRLVDPLAELVKIDPKSIGVGQYQHDVDQKSLQQSLEETVVSSVNSVGVKLNTASESLLSYVSGLGPSLAKAIVDYRDKNGVFSSRRELLNVPRFGNKAYEQAAAFLRIENAQNPLDNSAVHPERYTLVKKIASDIGMPLQNLVGNSDAVSKIDIGKYVTNDIGMPTLQDIVKELSKPGRDPRRKLARFEFDKSVQKIQDLRPGLKLPGIVTNITAFGAFVDIGVHQDGLVHISQMAEDFVSDPNQIVHLNQQVEVWVLQVDVDRKRINLSLIGDKKI